MYVVLLLPLEWFYPLPIGCFGLIGAKSKEIYEKRLFCRVEATKSRPSQQSGLLISFPSDKLRRVWAGTFKFSSPFHLRTTRKAWTLHSYVINHLFTLRVDLLFLVRKVMNGIHYGRLFPEKYNLGARLDWVGNFRQTRTTIVYIVMCLFYK